MIRSEGNEIVDDLGRPFQIKGVSLPDIAQCHRKGTLEKKIKHISGMGANTIRLPCYPSDVPNHILDRPLDESFFNEVLVPAVELSINLGLHVIVDYHDIGDMTEESTLKAKDFWTQAVQKLDNYSNVVYELFNEPVNGDGPDPLQYIPMKCWNLYRPYMQSLASHVRSMTDHLLIIGTPFFCKFISPAVVVPIDVKNIAYSAHCYQLAADERFVKRLDLKGYEEDSFFNKFYDKIHDKMVIEIESQYKQFNDIKTCSLEHPIIITEFGWSYDMQLSPRWFQDMQNLISDYGWVAWCHSYDWWPSMFVDEDETQLNRFGEEINQMFNK